ncbi:MAG: biopolymer transporter ExbD [Gammaproteobacteria bacterium]|nr:biopolymer transporter ExbD [Gammaproteobacteria bacterium]
MRRVIVADAEHEADDEINLTPMLDVVFIMLIFFIMVASFVKEAGIDVNRSDVSKPLSPEIQNILIAISENNQIWMDRRLIDPRAVRANIERLHAENPHATVVIQADKLSSNNSLVQVMNASREAGIYNFALAAGEE